MRHNFRWAVVGLVLLILTFSKSHATHIRAGEITVERISCQSLSFRITVTGWVDLESTVEFGGGYLDFGDGSDPVNLRDMATIVDEQDLGNLVGIVQFQIDHTYGAAGVYTLSYLEANRNAGILNMNNSVETTFYIETQIIIDPVLGCNNTPVLLIPPIDEGCIGAIFFHNPGGWDADGDSISYEITIPKRDLGTDVSNYRFPNDPSFGGTTEDGDLPTIFDIDPITGDIIWDAPAIAGEYNISFIVKEWRKIPGLEPQIMSWITRDMQIIIKDCDNERPELEIPEDVCVEAGTLIEEIVVGTDPDNDPVSIEAYGGPFELENSPATFSPFPPVFEPQPAYDTIRWQTNCSHVRNQPYQVTFKITDQPMEGPKLVGFEPWNITIVAPAPEGVDLTVNSNRTIELTWDQYFCQNASAVQIWRRVDSYEFENEECVTGMPEYAGYELIDEVNPEMTTYLDDNNGDYLDFGALYCYRLVAVFPDPAGGVSYASEEVCGIIEATAPVITNVTVDKTDNENGQITVKWTEPFDIDQTLFPPPYLYGLFRVRGINAEEAQRLNSDTVVVALAIPQLDTVFVNNNLDTEDEVYHFFVALYDINEKEIIVSSSASSVEVIPKPLFKEIELNWQADVPWSNNTQEFPMHYIYRDNVTSDENELVLIDSVNVNLDGFAYLDDGEFNNTELDERTLYCYYVVTQGSYGNDNLPEPLINLSHIVCAQPNDTIPPCAPVLEVEVTDCDTFFEDKSCNFSSYRNNLIWKKDEDCPESEDEIIRSYNIYYSRSGDDGSFELIDIVDYKDTTYTHSNIPSFAGCYYVTAVDRSGNESEPSNIACNDNCPNYQLPNVFTPNGDGFNDLFHALSPEDNSTEGNPDPDYDPSQCPRFVKSVTFRVFNRHGKEIYTFESGGENSILINWDGLSNDGQQVPSGVYYFVAEVQYDMIDPARRNETIKSWVQILR